MTITRVRIKLRPKPGRNVPQPTNVGRIERSYPPEWIDHLNRHSFPGAPPCRLKSIRATGKGNHPDATAPRRVGNAEVMSRRLKRVRRHVGIVGKSSREVLRRMICEGGWSSTFQRQVEMDAQLLDQTDRCIPMPAIAAPICPARPGKRRTEGRKRGAKAMCHPLLISVVDYPSVPRLVPAIEMGVKADFITGPFRSMDLLPKFPHHIIRS